MPVQNQTNAVIIGIDVAKDKLDICLLPVKKHSVVANEPKAIAIFLKALKHLKIDLVVCEPTGGHERGLLKVLHAHNIPIHVVHPNRAYHFAKSKGFFAKTDHIDAYMLTQYGQQENIQANSFADELQQQLEQLSARKKQIKAQLQNERNRKSQSYLDVMIKRSITRVIGMLEKECECIDQAITKLIQGDSVKQKCLEQLKTYKAVGNEIAQCLVTDLPELGSLNRNEIAGLVGLAPRNRDSGKKTGKRMIHGGRAEIRKLLYMAALVAIRHNPAMQVVYKRLRAAGKVAKVALVAVARKIIITLNTMVKKGTVWQARPA